MSHLTKKEIDTLVVVAKTTIYPLDAITQAYVVVPSKYRGESALELLKESFSTASKYALPLPHARQLFDSLVTDYLEGIELAGKFGKAAAKIENDLIQNILKTK